MKHLGPRNRRLLRTSGLVNQKDREQQNTKARASIKQPTCNTVNTFDLNAGSSLHLVIDGDASLRALHGELLSTGANAHLIANASAMSDLEGRLSTQFADKSFNSISIYSHARPGALLFGEEWITVDNLEKHQRTLTALGKALAPGGDLLLYGCDLAASQEGRRLVDQLAAMTQADVGASDDITGIAGDWNLEVYAGAVGSQPVDALTGMDWHGNLGTLWEPIRVPLHWVKIGSPSNGQRKLGIYASLGGSSTPQLFEFDTGGNGFYATYGQGKSAKWWGDHWSTTGKTFSQSYDSGMTYTGDAVTTDVTLFADKRARQPLFKAADIIVGQTREIINTKDKPPKQLWPLSNASKKPPVNGIFYGDFGMAPKPGQQGIDSIAAQLQYMPGITAGFRVHASNTNPWVQFGLTQQDIATLPTTFSLNRDGRSSPRGIPYYENLVVTGDLSIKPSAKLAKQTGAQRFQQATGFIFDTGASTTIHTGGGINIPNDLTRNGDGKDISKGSVVKVSALSKDPITKNQSIPFMRFKSGYKTDKNNVGIQQATSYYLNTGILPFLSNDLVYDLQAGRLTLIPRPNEVTFPTGV